MAEFIFGGETGIASPEDLERRRALVQALKLRGAGKPSRNQWEGINGLVQAIGGRIAENRLDQAEAAGRKGADEIFATFLRNGLSTTPHAEALSNSWMSPLQQDVLMDYFRSQRAALPPASKA